MADTRTFAIAPQGRAAHIVIDGHARCSSAVRLTEDRPGIQFFQGIEAVLQAGKELCFTCLRDRRKVKEKYEQDVADRAAGKYAYPFQAQFCKSCKYRLEWRQSARYFKCWACGAQYLCDPETGELKHRSGKR